MSTFTRDPLIAVLRIILAIMIGVLAIAGIALLIGMVGLPFVIDQVVAEIGSRAATLSPLQLILALEAMLACLVVMLAIVGLFLRDLWRILNSVGAGDPFVPANSVRLTRMAWLALAGQVWALVVGGLGVWLAGMLAEPEDVHVSFGFDGGGVLLILVLFVLARVFRHGTRLREDVEGTV